MTVPVTTPQMLTLGLGTLIHCQCSIGIYGLRHAGFSDIRYQTDRIKRGGLFLSALFAPFLWLGKYLLHRRERRYDLRIYQQTLRPLNEINSLRNLAGRNLIAICAKPGRSPQGK